MEYILTMKYVVEYYHGNSNKALHNYETIQIKEFELLSNMLNIKHELFDQCSYRLWASRRKGRPGKPRGFVRLKTVWNINSLSAAGLSPVRATHAAQVMKEGAPRHTHINTHSALCAIQLKHVRKVNSKYSLSSSIMFMNENPCETDFRLTDQHSKT